MGGHLWPSPHTAHRCAEIILGTNRPDPGSVPCPRSRTRPCTVKLVLVCFWPPAIAWILMLMMLMQSGTCTQLTVGRKSMINMLFLIWPYYCDLLLLSHQKSVFPHWYFSVQNYVCVSLTLGGCFQIHLLEGGKFLFAHLTSHFKTCPSPQLVLLFKKQDKKFFMRRHKCKKTPD